MSYFAGLDVSVKETSVCIVDDAGKIIPDQGRPYRRTLQYRHREPSPRGMPSCPGAANETSPPACPPFFTGRFPIKEPVRLHW
jgi:hypothetical protein